MKSTRTLVAAVFAATAVLSGCASNAPYGNSTTAYNNNGYTNSPVQGSGTIDSIQVIQGEARTGGGDSIVYQGLVAEGAEMAMGYTFPHLLVDHAMRNPHVRPGAWRGVNLNQNAVYLECFIDELAHAAGQDSLVFRRKLMAKHPKHLAVLEAAAKGIG